MENARLLSAVEAYRQDCSNMHSFRGVRNVYILHYIEKGSGIFEVGSKKYKLSEGCVFLIRPGDKVYYHPDADNPYIYKWVDFTGSLSEPLLSTTAFDDVSPVTPPLPQLEGCFDRLIENFDPIPSLNPLVLELFAQLIAAYPAGYIDSREHNIAQTAREYILSNLHKSDFRVQSVAEQIGVSRSCLWRMFKEQFGVSPVQFIIEERMKNARRLLALGERVKDTAAACGFENQMYFSLAFKNRHSMSPEEYRTQHVKKN